LRECRLHRYLSKEVQLGAGKRWVPLGAWGVDIWHHVGVPWRPAGPGVESMDSHETRQGSERAQDERAVREGRILGTHTRRTERRQSFRIIYPLSLAPKVRNDNMHVINLSQQGIMFRWEGDEDACPAKLTLGSIANLQVQFHDGEIMDVEVKIIRCQSEVHSRRTVYAGILQPALSAARISKEEAYLLRHVPDFCRVAWYSADPLGDD